MVEPRDRRPRAQPIGCRHGKNVEGMTQRFSDTLQTIEGVNCSQNVGTVGALAAFGLEQALLAEKGQHGLEEQQFGVAGEQASAKFA